LRGKPGGTLVYCTCSLEPEEGEQQISGFLGLHPDFGPCRTSIPGLSRACYRDEGWIRTLPCQLLGEAEGLDGFFMVALQRRV
jgi:16S rRNA (cytosine967-C5)-methyltransferase